MVKGILLELKSSPVKKEVLLKPEWMKVKLLVFKEFSRKTYIQLGHIHLSENVALVQDM